MLKLSELLSKRIVNLYDGTYEGTIKNVIFNKEYSKIKYLVFFDDDNEEFLLSTDKIYKVGTDCLLVKNKEGITLKMSAENLTENNPIHFLCYNLNGQAIGDVCEVYFDEKFKIKHFVANSTTILPKNILKIGTNIMILKGENNKVLLNHFKPKKIMLKENVAIQKVEILLPQLMPTIATMENATTERPAMAKPFLVTNQPINDRVITNQNFLIGRKTTKTIYGINNEILIKKDVLINNKNIELAKLHNKLTELAVFSKLK